jgi:fumarate hydratase class II
MNANEVIATLATRRSPDAVHPTTTSTSGQSSNDVIPTAIQVACRDRLAGTAAAGAAAPEVDGGPAREGAAKVVKTGRTHLMDAMPLTLGQELSAWSAQLASAIERLDDSAVRLQRLAARRHRAIGTGSTPIRATRRRRWRGCACCRA